MTLQNPLSKRIKRHVVGREQTFFAATAPGLETLCFDELMSLPLSINNVMVVPGGVAFKGRLHDCYAANLNLRTPSRILMRISVFKASNFSRLEKKLGDVPWELFLHPGNLAQISVTSRHSRLYHKDAISERFHASMSERFARNGPYEENQNPPSSYNQQIFVRVAEDHFTVSIDSSGELLYKRGMKKHRGNAPIRETIAAAMLKLGRYDRCRPLVDPMCGSGTFSLEAAMMACHIPPGWQREFAFMGWPAFRPQRWAYMKQEAEKQFTRTDTPLIFASDKDRTACDLLERQVGEYDLSGVIKVSCMDFFDFYPRDMTKQTGLVVLNPPYGLRMGTPGGSSELFHSICRHLQKEYTGWNLALIAPTPSLARAVPFKLKSHSIYHGGLNLVLLVGRIA